MVMLLPRDAGAPAAAPMGRATSAFPTGGFIGRAMSQSREAAQPVCARRSGGARSLGAAGPLNRDGGRVEGTRIAETDPAESRTNRRRGTRPGSSMPRTPHRPLAFPRTAQSCAPYYRDGFCNLRDRRGSGRPQCLEPAVLRSDCGEKFPGVLGPAAGFHSHSRLPSRAQCGAGVAS